MVLYAAILIIAALCGITLKSIKLNEDLQPMIPAGQSEAARDIALLQQAPFMQKVVFNLKAEPQIDQKTLAQAADRLAGALKRPFYDRAIAGPPMPPAEVFFPWLLEAAPALMTEKDRQEIRSGLNSQSIHSKLQDIRVRLNSPEGWVMKGLLQEDPLDLHRVTLDKFRFLNMFKGMVLKDQHFISADGRNALVVADTPLKITDSQGAKDLILYTQKIIENQAQPGISVSFLCGHAYTYANAETIKADLYVIFSCTSITILVLLFLFMQNWRAVFVFLVPASVVLMATAGVLAAYQTISAITIAFGSVLMGIADDYPDIHLFLPEEPEGLWRGSGSRNRASGALQRVGHHGHLQRPFFFRSSRSASNRFFFYCGHHRLPGLFPPGFAPLPSRSATGPVHHKNSPAGQGQVLSSRHYGRLAACSGYRPMAGKPADL